MSSLAEFRRLFHYDAWANRQVATSFKSQEPVPVRSLGWLAHILWAERLWWERLKQIPQSHKTASGLTVAQCSTEVEEVHHLWNSYLALPPVDLLTQSVSYTNSKGEDWSNTVADILTHVVMHSAYHRGQIASDMRAAGKIPAYTDFIHAVRQDLVE